MKVKYLVLGCGLSGLSFVNGLRSNEYVILEKEEVPGGLCRTHKKGGYIWDYAGHFFHFQNERTKSYFESVFRDEKCFRQLKNSKIYYKGDYIDYPFQKNIHQLKKDDFIDCLYNLYFRKEKEQYNSFKEMLIGKFGLGISERFLIPYNEKLYACDLNLLDQNAMGRFFPYANLTEILENMKNAKNSSYNDIFIYPKDGAHVVIEHLLKNVDKEKIHLREEVVHINLEEKVVITEKEKYEYDFLISTIPLNIFLTKCNIFFADNLSWNKVLVFNIGFDKSSKDKAIHWIYYPDKKINFYRVGFYNNILQDEMLSIYVEIGYSSNEIIDIDEQFAITLKNLKESGIIDTHKVVAYEALLIDPAYVHISARSKEYIDQIMPYLKRGSVFLIGRYANWTYCSMEDCFLAAYRLAQVFDRVN